MLFNLEKFETSNKSYGSTTIIIANLNFMINTITPVLIMYHLEENLSAKFFCPWSTGLIKRKLLMQCRLTKYKKPSLHIIWLTGRLLAYSCCYHWSSLHSNNLPACNFIKKRLQHRYFPLNNAKFLRTHILKTYCLCKFWSE